MSAATLIKRFGSKRGLLIALSQRWVDSIDSDPPVDADESPLAALHRFSVGSYIASDNADDAPNHLSSLSMDLGDPELTRLLALGWQRNRSQLEHLITRAVDAGDLPHAPDPGVAARTMFALLEGTFLGWTVEPHGSLIDILDTEFHRLTESWT